MSFTWNGSAVNKITPIYASYSIADSLYYANNATSFSVMEDRIKKELALHISQQIVQHMEIERESDPMGMKHTYTAKAYIADMAKTHPPLPNPTTLPYGINTAVFNGTSGTLSMPVGPNNSTVTVSGASAQTSAYQSDYEKFRVCEFTKNGKVTRVELQYYNDGFWEKIKRVKIEE